MIFLVQQDQPPFMKGIIINSSYPEALKSYNFCLKYPPFLIVQLFSHYKEF